MVELHHRVSGIDGPLVVLLHGMGATGEVWRPVVDELESRWRGRVLVPDLRGHGRSPRADSYDFADMAADVADLVTRFPPVEEFVVVGHSMGGVVALELASGRHGRLPRSVGAVGVKVTWTAAELERARELASRPPRLFTRREEAGAWFLRLTGLDGLVDPSGWPELVDSGVVEGEEGWRVAQDPRTLAVGAPAMADLVDGARCPVVLARGETDPMVSTEELSGFGPVHLFTGAGHNVMVESPVTFGRWLAGDLLSIG